MKRSLAGRGLHPIAVLVILYCACRRSTTSDVLPARSARGAAGSMPAVARGSVPATAGKTSDNPSAAPASGRGSAVAGSAATASPNGGSAVAGSAATASPDGGPAATAVALALLPGLPFREAVKLACAGRDECRLDLRRPAGVDNEGRPLEVLRLALFPKQRPKKADDAGCDPFEHWSVVYDRDGKRKPKVSLLFNQCEASDKITQPDQVLVSANRVEIQASPNVPLSFQSVTRILRLSPLSVREETSSESARTRQEWYATRWSWEDFRGEKSWYHDECASEARQRKNAEKDPADDSDADGYVFIPQVKIDDSSFLGDGWRSVDLGSCSALVDASGTQGYVVHGPKGHAADAAMRVVAVGKADFVVEIRDDRWVLRGDSPLHEDHIEIWTSPKRPEECKDQPSGQQWLVRAEDGAVAAGFGKPSPAIMKVQRAEDGAVLRLRVRPAVGFGGISFVYSDSDDGTTQKRLVSTSRLRFGDASSLGTTREIRPKEAVCRVAPSPSGRMLRPVDLFAPPPPIDFEDADDAPEE